MTNCNNYVITVITMTYDKFVDLVCDMRAQQSGYFSTRQPFYLREAISLEKKVDRIIENHLRHKERLVLKEELTLDFSK